MATDRTPSRDTDEAWIAKYRSALKDIPVQQSRSTRFHEALHRARSVIVSRAAGRDQFNPQNRCRFRNHKQLETGTWQSRTLRWLDRGQGRPRCAGLHSDALSGAGKERIASTITNTRGRFIFPSPKAGTYHLLVSSKALSPRGVPVGIMPVHRV